VLRDAVTRGVAPQTKAAVVEARTQGGQAIDVGTLGDLFEYSAVLLSRYAPEEVDLISGLTAPRVK
jgi:hypothetical protein